MSEIAAVIIKQDTRHVLGMFPWFELTKSTLLVVCAQSMMFSVSHVWRRCGAPTSCSFIRRFSTTQLNTKQHFNIGTIGDESHGKTTLARAILNTLDHNPDLHGTREDFNELNKDKMSQLGGSRTINFEFETQKRHYLLADNTGNKDHVGNMIVGCSGPLECAILVVSAVDGLSHMAKQHLIIAKHLDIKQIIVYFNKLDDESYDAELQELIEMETVELLEKCNFDSLITLCCPF